MNKYDIIAVARCFWWSRPFDTLQRWRLLYSLYDDPYDLYVRVCDTSLVHSKLSSSSFCLSLLLLYLFLSLFLLFLFMSSIDNWFCLWRQWKELAIKSAEIWLRRQTPREKSESEMCMCSARSCMSVWICACWILCRQHYAIRITFHFNIFWVSRYCVNRKMHRKLKAFALISNSYALFHFFLCRSFVGAHGPIFFFLVFLSRPAFFSCSYTLSLFISRARHFERWILRDWNGNFPYQAR